MTELAFEVPGAGRVSAVYLSVDAPVATLVLAHGAGAGMRHPVMAALAEGLLARDIATMRFQFPFMEAGSKRPDRPAVAQAAVVAAVAAAGRLAPGSPLFAGGKSFGGRMTSQAQAAMPLHDVRGLVFFGFPLHPAGTPSTARAAHLAQVEVPMLFLQGTRDALAEIALMRETVAGLGPRATLAAIEDGDHSFHVRKRSGRSDRDAREEMLDRVAAWIADIR